MRPIIGRYYTLNEDIDVYIVTDLRSFYTNTGMNLKKGTKIQVMKIIDNTRISRDGQIGFYVCDTDYTCWVFEKDFIDNFTIESLEEVVSK